MNTCCKKCRDKNFAGLPYCNNASCECHTKLVNHQEVLRDLGTEWRKEWEESKVRERVLALESYAQVHGWTEFKGETIPELIERLLASQRKTLLREVEEVIGANMPIEGVLNNQTVVSRKLAIELVRRLAPPTDL